MDLGIVDSKTRRKLRKQLGSRSTRRLGVKVEMRAVNDTAVLPKHRLLKLAQEELKKSKLLEVEQSQPTESYESRIYEFSIYAQKMRGVSYRKLAREYKLSEYRIRQIVKKQKERNTTSGRHSDANG